MATNRESYDIPASNSSSRKVPTVLNAWHEFSIAQEGEKKGKVVGDDVSNTSSDHQGRMEMPEICSEAGKELDAGKSKLVNVKRLD